MWTYICKAQSLLCNSVQFMMANGQLVRVLIHTDVTKYLQFKAVDGSYVLNKGKVSSLQ